MVEKDCNLWQERAEFLCIPTSGAVADDGTAIMDTPIAREAAKRFRGLEVDLGRLITSRGNHVHLIRPGVLSFPVKQFQWSRPTVQVIERSAAELAALVGDKKTLLPRPGCGPGELAWDEVAQALASLPDNVVVVQHA